MWMVHIIEWIQVIALFLWKVAYFAFFGWTIILGTMKAIDLLLGWCDKWIVIPFTNKIGAYGSLVYFFRNRSRILAYMKREREIRRGELRSPEDIINDVISAVNDSTIITNDDWQVRVSELKEEINKLIQKDTVDKLD